MGYLITTTLGSTSDDLFDFVYLNIEDPFTAKIISCNEQELEELIQELIKEDDEEIE